MAKIETTTLADSIFKKIKTLSIKESLIPALAEVYTASAIDEMIDDILPRDVVVVTNHDELLATYPASTNLDKFVWVLVSQGTSWLYGSLGGTYYDSGLYWSNGTSWIYIPNPFSASQSEVDGGTINDRFVTPSTLSNASKWGTKQNSLGFTSETSNKFLRDDNTFQAIDMAVGGYANNLYFSETASDVSGYESLNYTPDTAEHVETWTITQAEGEKTLKNYIYPTGVSVTLLPAGTWSFNFFGKVDNSGGNTQLGITYFARHIDNSEDILFTAWSNEINNTVDTWFSFNFISPNYTLVATDRMGARVKIRTTSASSKTVTYVVGDGYSAYINNPNKIRHSQLRDLNGDSTAQHFDSAITKSTPINVDKLGLWDSITSKFVGINWSDILTLLVPSSRTVNSKALTSNISLDKNDIGLGNVDNTSDVNKPISTAQANSIATKADNQGTVLYHTSALTSAGTIGISGNVVTGSGTSFTTSMVNARLTVAGVNYIIATAPTSTSATITTTATVASGTSFAIYARAISVLSSGIIEFYQKTDNASYNKFFDATTGSGLTIENIRNFSDYFAWFSTELMLNSNGKIEWASGTNARTTKDIGLRRSAAGTLEIYDGLTANSTTPRDLALRNLIVDKTAGSGIKVDIVTPTFGWKDLIGTIVPRAAAPNQATLSTYNGQIREWAFAAGDRSDNRFHIPHDYVPGTDLYIHVHWSHIGTAISGNAVFNFYSSFAKGFNQSGSTFATVKNTTATYNTVNIATTPQYAHMLTEIQLSSNGGSATLLDSATLEVDGIILCNFDFTTIPTITGGTTNQPFVHSIDIHYQSTQMSTKNKAPNFYA